MLIVLVYFELSSFILQFTFSSIIVVVSSLCVMLAWFSFSANCLCLGQSGPIMLNKTGKNIREFKTPRLMSIKSDLQNEMNM